MCVYCERRNKVIYSLSKENKIKLEYDKIKIKIKYEPLDRLNSELLESQK